MTPPVEPLVVLACILVAPGTLLHASAGAPPPRLRFLHPALQAVAQAAEQRAPSFRALVERLRRGDVVVYVRFGELPTGLIGQLAFVSAAGGLRYVVVDIARGLSQSTAIAILGHELQHAIEVLDRPQIVDQTTFADAYARSGATRRRLAHGGTGFDTAAAVAAGRRIRQELAAAPVAVATR